MAQADSVTTPLPLTSAKPASAGRQAVPRRSFLAGLAVTVPIAATASTAALAAPIKAYQAAAEA